MAMTLFGSHRGPTKQELEEIVEGVQDDHRLVNQVLKMGAVTRSPDQFFKAADVTLTTLSERLKAIAADTPKLEQTEEYSNSSSSSNSKTP
jgi:hypothetical protein